MSAASTATRFVAPRALCAIRLFPHLVGLGLPYDAARSLTRRVPRVSAAMLNGARRRTHYIAPPPRSVHESLGISRAGVDA
jgi:hypothetical protein